MEQINVISYIEILNEVISQNLEEINDINYWTLDKKQQYHKLY